MGLGGAHIGMRVDENDGVRIVRTAIDNGVNFLDNCWDYNDGGAKSRMGKALRDGYRHKRLPDDQDRRPRPARPRRNKSTNRCAASQTDHIDLLQFHEVIRMDDPERIFAAGGAMEAALEARKAGKIRYIGFTGHKSPGDPSADAGDRRRAITSASTPCRCRST